MRCSYCYKQIKDDAQLVVDYLIMPTIEENNGVKVKKNGILQNKIACRECVGKIASGKLKM